MKKTVALILCTIICTLAFSACRGTGKALTVNGREVDQAEFAFYLNFNRLSLFSNKSKYTKDELARARAEAITQIVANETVRAKCKELGLEPTKEQKAEVKSNKKAFVSSIGGEKKYQQYLKESCLTDRGYLKLLENDLYYELLHDYVAENSIEALTDEELKQFFLENYICVKYIRLSCTDEEGQPKSDKEMDALWSLAQQVSKKAARGEVSFDALIYQYSDDANVPGGSEGIIVSVLDAKNQPYLEAAFNLSDNGTSEVITDGDSLFIVKRLPVSAEYYEENRSYINETAVNLSFAGILEEWTAQAIVKTENAINKINFENLKKYVR